MCVNNTKRYVVGYWVPATLGYLSNGREPDSGEA